jgi:hypothetical protein
MLLKSCEDQPLPSLHPSRHHSPFCSGGVPAYPSKFTLRRLRWRPRQDVTVDMLKEEISHVKKELGQQVRCV